MEVVFLAWGYAPPLPRVALARPFFASVQRTVDRAYIAVIILDLHRSKQESIGFRVLPKPSRLLIPKQLQGLEKLSFGHRQQTALPVPPYYLLVMPVAPGGFTFPIGIKGATLCSICHQFDISVKILPFHLTVRYQT